MAVTYGFFNSVNGDRTYNADQMSEYWKGIIGDGVVPSYNGQLQVSAGSGMSVNVASGRIYIDSKFCDNDTVLSVPITTAHATLNRYTAVIVRLDRTNRLMTITTKDGTPASNPSAPAMTNSATIIEKCLAYVYVPAGVSSISSSNITDKRSDTGVCGYAGGVISTASMQLTEYYQRTVLASGSSNIIPLNISGYSYSASDIFFVYINGLFAAPNVDYYLDTSKAIPELHPNASAAGTEVIVKIIKPIASIS